MKKIVIIISLFFVTIQVATAQVAGHEYAKVVYKNYDCHLTNDEFFKIARSVTFPVNQYTVPENSSFYRELVKDIIPVMNARKLQLSDIIIRGAASPEGSYDLNLYLANKRQESIRDLVDKYMKYPSAKNSITPVESPYDFYQLLLMMRKGNDKDFATVHSIYKKHDGDAVAIKSELLTVNHGKLWNRLFKAYFPKMRAAHVVLVFKRPDLKLLMSDYNSKLKFVAPVVTDTILPEKSPIAAPVVVMVPETTTKIKKQAYPVLSLKTDLLYDFFYYPETGFQPIPNFEVEFYFRNGKYSILAEYEFPWWKNEEKKEFFQIQNWQLEPRYYFKHDHFFNGFYLGAYVNFNRYDFALKDHDGSGDQGEGLGAGLSFGYVIPLGHKTSRWKLELNIKGGYYETHYDPYDYEYNTEKQTGKYYYRWYDSPTSFRKRNWRYRWIGPTGVGINLSYDLWRSSKWPSRK